MKMNYSNAMLLNSLSESYQMKQQLNGSKIKYLIAGVLSGIVICGVIYFNRNKHTNAVISNLKNQNLKLRLENESQRKSINKLSAQSIIKPVIKETESSEKSSV